MLRNKIAIVLLFIAQLLILGHGMVLHHHENFMVINEHVHHTEEKSVELGTLFSNIQHIGEHITFTNESIEIYITKELSQPPNAVFFDYQHLIENIVDYQRHRFPPERHVIYLTPHYGSYSLRGPPSFIVA